MQAQPQLCHAKETGGQAWWWWWGIWYGEPAKKWKFVICDKILFLVNFE